MRKATREQILEAFQRLGTQRRVAAELGLSQPSVSAALRRSGIHIGRGNNQPRHDEEKILALWNEHHNQKKVGRLLGIRQSAVGKVLRRKGIHVGRGKREPVHRLPMDQIAERYRTGETCRQLGNAFGVDAEVIRRRLHSLKVVRRKGGASGDKHPHWKGGAKQTMHEYRRQAYEVVAICLGRPLPRAWVIHHIDENPQNNNPSNLLLFRNLRAHTSFHQLLLKRHAANPLTDATQLALESGAVPLPPPPAPIAFSPDRDPHDLYETLRTQGMNRIA